MNRFDAIKAAVTGYLIKVNPDYAPVGIAHLAYSACLCALLARKRGGDMELAQTAGYLHDVWLHERAPYDEETVRLHASEGARLAAGFLRDNGEYTDKEISVIVEMIENHDFTDRQDNLMCEIMKDADMLSHYLNASAAGRERDFNPRAANVLAELGLQVEILTDKSV